MEKTTGSSTLPLFHSSTPPLPLKILLLSQEFPPGPGGLGTHAYELARNLPRFGWSVCVVTQQDHATERAIAEFNSVQPYRIRRIPRRGGILGTMRDRWTITAEEIRGFRPDVMIATGDRAIYVAALLARRFRTLWVAIEHGSLPPGIERKIKQWAFHRANAVICVSNYTRREMERIGVKTVRTEVIPNGADTSRFRTLPKDDVAEYKESRGFAATRILLTVGSVTTRKGQDTVIRALPRIVEDVPNTQYLCAGVKVTAEQFSELANTLGVGDHVRFLGPVDNDEIVRLMNAADVFLMTSRHTGDQFEGYGIAAVEAALCGTPSVVTGDSGLSEAILDGVTGITVSQDDPAAVAESVLQLLTDDDLRRRMGEAARHRAVQEQAWEGRVSEYHRVLTGIRNPE